MNFKLEPTYKKVLEFFEMDDKKTTLWFNTPNPNLGNVSPLSMIAMGRHEHLKKWIDNQIEEGQPPS